ncbi:hypothetical protein GGR50DRAFT_466929 [Xylaria sp. CBS 124048]|nr:hypothetical protein GGR50DRAFT_466929 [Xylaria sp. CBS 124048]
MSESDSIRSPFRAPAIPSDIFGVLIDETVRPAANASGTPWILVKLQYSLSATMRLNFRALGVKVVEVVAPSTYLCFYRGVGLAHIGRLFGVMYVDVYRPEYKVCLRLKEMGSTARKDMQVPVLISLHRKKAIKLFRSFMCRLISTANLDLWNCNFHVSPDGVSLKVRLFRVYDVAMLDEVRRIILNTNELEEPAAQAPAQVVAEIPRHPNSDVVHPSVSQRRPETEYPTRSLYTIYEQDPYEAENSEDDAEFRDAMHEFRPPSGYEHFFGYSATPANQAAREVDPLSTSSPVDGSPSGAVDSRRRYPSDA